MDPGALMSGAAAVVGIVLTILQVSSTRSRVHTIASQSMDLAKKLGDDLEVPGLESRRGKAHDLRAQLWERADAATQEYLLLTVPKRMNIIDAIAWTVILILLAIIAWTLKGIPADWQWARWVVGLAIPVLVFVYLFRQILSSSRRIEVEELLSEPESLDHRSTPLRPRARQYGLVAGSIAAGLVIAGLMRGRRSN